MDKNSYELRSMKHEKQVKQDAIKSVQKAEVDNLNMKKDLSYKKHELEMERAHFIEDMDAQRKDIEAEIEKQRKEIAARILDQEDDNLCIICQDHFLSANNGKYF